MSQIKHVGETLKGTKEHLDKEQQIIITARQDLEAISSLLAKMNQLPAIAGIKIANGLQDKQLEKFVKEIYNYNCVIQGFVVQLNKHKDELEVKRKRDVEKELYIDSYNVLHSEVESLITWREMEKIILKKKEGEMILLTNAVQLSVLDIDFIKCRLESRSQLYDDYMDSNPELDFAITPITSELGKHIDDINNLCNEFISYKLENRRNPERFHHILMKIREKEDILDLAADLLKEYNQVNPNLQQLFDAIRLNNMTHIFELLIKDFQQLFHNIGLYKEEIRGIRSQILRTEGLIQTKKRELGVTLDKIISKMKAEPLTYPNVNNKDLLNYFTSLYKIKKENQDLMNLVEDIKQKGTEVIGMCRNVIKYQEKSNEKLNNEITEKTSLIKTLEGRYRSLQSEVNENSRAIILQSRLTGLQEENRHLTLMNAYFKDAQDRMDCEVGHMKQRIKHLERKNFQLMETNTGLERTNAELREKLLRSERNAEFMERSLMNWQFDDEEYYEYDSDESYLV